jgi:transposase
MLDVVDAELVPLDRQLRSFARRQPGCRALSERLYGVGPVCATAILAELGDCRRFGNSDDAVRHSGLDVTVHQSDQKRAPGHLSHEGPEVLRWALFEAAQSAARLSSPDHAYFCQVRERIDSTRACLSVARKLCRRAYHILRELGEEALAPLELDSQPEEAMKTAA